MSDRVLFWLMLAVIGILSFAIAFDAHCHQHPESSENAVITVKGGKIYVDGKEVEKSIVILNRKAP